MTKGKFGEPWKEDQFGHLVDSSGTEIALGNPNGSADIWHMDRVLECVNALEGFDPQKVRALLEELILCDCGMDKGTPYPQRAAHNHWANKARECREDDDEQ